MNGEMTLPIDNGVYRTAPRRVSWFARAFPGLVFYCKEIGIVWRAARKARRGDYDSGAWASSSLEILRALESVGVKFEITGVEHLQNTPGPCLIVANHMSTLETMVLPSIVEPIKRSTFVVKRQLVEYPVFKHVMRASDPITISQTDPRGDLKRMLAQGQERLARGVSVIVFPEGRRARQFRPQRFNSIGVKLAARAAAPIIPLALSTAAWGIGRIIPDFGKINPAKKVRFRFAPPVSVSTPKGATENDAIIKFIEQTLAEWAAADGGG